MLKKINDALPGLILGILIYGAVVELCGVWFVADRLRFTAGLFIGIALACGLAVNMAVVLRDGTDPSGGRRARTNVAARSLLRYVLVAVVLLVMNRWELGSWWAAFIGIFGLKVSAYLQPLIGK